MKGARPWQVFLALGAIGLFSGCLFTSKTKLNDAQAQGRILSQQNSAQLAEIENLKTHGKGLENKLIRSDEEIALLKEQVDLDRRQMANYEREHNELYEQFKALARDRAQQTSPDAGPAQTGTSNSRTVR
jgi:chromosome segregation ATPase